MKGSVTVEMLYIMPVFFLVFLTTVYSTFYYHDKAVLYGAAHETAAVVSIWDRRARGVSNGDVTSLCQERIQGKLILFSGANISASVDDKKVVIEVGASKKFMKVLVQTTCVVTRPEAYIRSLRSVGDVID